MAVASYGDLANHLGHEFECVSYGEGENVALECVTCNEVMIDFDRPANPFLQLREQINRDQYDYLTGQGRAGPDQMHGGVWYVDGNGSLHNNVEVVPS